MNNTVDNNKNERIEWLDIAKAILIIMIVLQHTLRFGYLDVFVSSFEIPCFFILAGITFKKSNFKKYLIDKSKRLLLPYLFFGLISIFIYEIIGTQTSGLLDVNINSSLTDNLFGLIYCNCKMGNMKWNTPLYFLPLYFVSALLVNVFETKLKNENKTKYRLLFIVISIFLSYFVTINNELCLPLFSEASLYYSAFIEIGIISKEYLHKDIDKKYYLTIFCLLIMCVCVSIYNYPYGPHLFIMGKNYFLYTINAIVLSFITIIISKLIKSSYLLGIIGRNTLGILCMHKFPTIFFASYIPFINSIITAEKETFLMDVTGIAVSIFSIVLCLLFIYVIMLVCPQILGENKKRNIFDIQEKYGKK